MKSAFGVALLGLALACGMPTGVSGQSRGGSGPRVGAPTGRPSGRSGGPRTAPSWRRGALPPFRPGPRAPFAGRPHRPFAFSSWWFGLFVVDPFETWGSAFPDGIPAPLASEAPDDRPIGGLQLDIEPRRARVYVDGQYAGRVEQFSGYYQHLDLYAGMHVIEVFEPGYDPLATYVIVSPGRTETYRGTLAPGSGR